MALEDGRGQRALGPHGFTVALLKRDMSGFGAFPASAVWSPAGRHANAKGRMVLCGEGEAMTGVDVGDRTLWRAPGGGVLYRTPAMADGVVYVLDRFFGLVAVDADSGQRRWTLRDDSGIASSPVAGTGVVYFADNAGCLTAVDAATGDVRWKWRPRWSKMSMPTVADGSVYVGNDEGLVAMDAATGEERWRLETRGEVCSTPVVADGIVYVGSRDEFLYAIHT
ncbi:PQQ-binding-like beta-propeller repeat protein [Streptomyces hyaluromycini]|uniref:PQQ-binding-like beta-propeller repeat protein n=1 Tax=Streptomyces hyaluromycini TaxID=1377993 RepID=A0ABV1X1P9_9ACTN